MKLRYTPFMEMILAYGFLGLGLAADPATVWAVVAVLESGKRVHGDHLLFTVGRQGRESDHMACYIRNVSKTFLKFPFNKSRDLNAQDVADILKKKSANPSLYFLKLPKKFRRDWISRIVFLQGIFSSAPSSNRVETALTGPHRRATSMNKRRGTHKARG
jgi:hypothetical protein